MSYANKQTSDYESESFGGTLEPGIYDGVLESITKGSYQDSNGITRTPLVFTYKTVTGEVHVQNEVEQTEEAKQDNQVNRVGYLLSRFVPKEKVAENDSQNWEQYRNWVIATLGEAHVNVPIQFKVVGNVYEGKASARIPAYKGQVIRKDSGEALGFSNTEKNSNNEYYNFQKQQADTEKLGSLPSSGLPGTVPLPGANDGGAQPKKVF